MAANILAIWSGDHAAMGAKARAHAQQFSWERSMETLFGQLYPAAFAARAASAAAAPAAGRRKLASA